MKEQIDHYFAVVDFTSKIEVLGGENFLHKDLAEFLEYLYKYNNQFGYVTIVSNGTINPNEAELNVFKKYGKQLDVLIDNYGADLSKMAYEMDTILSENNIVSEIRNHHKDDSHCGGWVDFVDLSKKYTENEAIVIFINVQYHIN